MCTDFSRTARTSLLMALALLLALAPLACELDEEAALDPERDTDPEVILDYGADDGPAAREPNEISETDGSGPDESARDDSHGDEATDVEEAETAQGAVFTLGSLTRTTDPSSDLWADLLGDGLEPELGVLGDGHEYLIVEITVAEVGSGHLAPAEDRDALLLPEQQGGEPVYGMITEMEFKMPVEEGQALETIPWVLGEQSRYVLMFEVPEDARADAVRLFLDHYEAMSPAGEAEGVESTTVDIPLE